MLMDFYSGSNCSGMKTINKHSAEMTTFCHGFNPILVHSSKSIWKFPIVRKYNATTDVINAHQEEQASHRENVLRMKNLIFCLDDH